MNGQSIWLVILFLFLMAMAPEILAATKIEFRIDDSNAKRLPCRIHLQDENGQAQRSDGNPFWHDHFVCSGQATSTVKPGVYRYTIERGPEYAQVSGKVEIANGQTKSVTGQLARISNLREAGWYSADLHIHRPIHEVETLMKAEDLDFGPLISWWNRRSTWADAKIPAKLVRRFDGHRLYTLMAGEDEREGGALLYFRLKKPIEIRDSKREFPSPMKFVTEAKNVEPNVWIDIEKPFWWDVPVWLASGKASSIGIANNHMCRSEMLANEAWGKPRDTNRLKPPRGNGFWTQEIYYHVLNCGLRIPPSAGSASGVLRNPVGYNRVYVYLGKPRQDSDQPVLTRERFFDGLSKGNCFVTNGPLLVVKANGRLPGNVMKFDASQALEMDLKIQLTSRDRITRLEVIQNGKIVRKIDCSDKVSQFHTVSLTAETSGWFLVRAIADVEETFRFASTAPWYIEAKERPKRISKTSASFFVDWIDERMQRVRNNLQDPDELRSVLIWQERSRAYWQDLADQANAK